LFFYITEHLRNKKTEKETIININYKKRNIEIVLQSLTHSISLFNIIPLLADKVITLLADTFLPAKYKLRSVIKVLIKEYIDLKYFSLPEGHYYELG